MLAAGTNDSREGGICSLREPMTRGKGEYACCANQWRRGGTGRGPQPTQLTQPTRARERLIPKVAEVNSHARAASSQVGAVNSLICYHKRERLGARLERGSRPRALVRHRRSGAVNLRQAGVNSRTQGAILQAVRGE
eukprot:5402235-Pyramimonas_sp.AAC.1